MDVLEMLQKRVQTLDEEMKSGRLISDIIRDNDYVIVEMNTEDQLYERGITATGVSIADYEPYSEYTIALKEIKGQPTDRVTLRDVGDFQRSFEVETDNEKMTIVAGDIKTIKLTHRYGEEIIGLTEENIGIFEKEILFPELMKKTKEILL